LQAKTGQIGAPAIRRGSKLEGQERGEVLAGHPELRRLVGLAVRPDTMLCIILLRCMLS
jgi:hypothetical protein